MEDYQLYRQRFNLSMTAWEVIHNDAPIFLIKKKPSFAGMINLILEMYMEDSDAAIENAILRRKNYLEEQLAEYADEEAKEKVIDILTAKYIEELRDKIATYPCDINKSSSLTRENYETTLKWRDHYSCYGNSVAKFFKTVIEEYARKPYYEREGIILRKTIEELGLCMEKRRLLRLTLKDGKHYDVRPYKICHDPDYNYHYLVGMSKESGTEYDEKISSFRVSKILGIRQLKEPSGKITKSEANEIELRLKNSGTQFLLSDQETIIVRLTKRGKKEYESRLHLRPNYAELKQVDDDTWLYTFECTPIQAEFYFFKFGADAEVIAPKYLREKFCKKYFEAYHEYDTTSSGQSDL